MGLDPLRRPAGDEAGAGPAHGRQAASSSSATRSSTCPAPDLAGWAIAHTARHGLARRWSLWYQEYPVLLSPVWSQPAFPLDFDIDSPTARSGRWS